MTDHITITKSEGTWVVRAGGAIIGESSNVLELVEPGQEPVAYFPRADIAMDFLEASSHKSVRPQIGEASYYSIITKSLPIKDAAWSFEAPKAGVDAIKDHLAFYSSRVTVEEI